MVKRKTSSDTGRAGPPPFTLRREVLVAYLAPALMAGGGGLATGQPDLTLAAGTSIAGTSAVVAALLGGWLQRRGARRAWRSSVPRIVLAPGLGLAAAAVAALTAWSVTDWAALWPVPHHAPWPDRLRLDLPISAALAATIITWRWRGTQATTRGVVSSAARQDRSTSSSTT